MKKTIYIISFTALGILLQLLIHELVEIWYIGLLLDDFLTYGFNLSWDNWYFIHHVGTIILFLGGAVFGYLQGKFWWSRIYKEDIRKLKQ